MNTNFTKCIGIVLGGMFMLISLSAQASLIATEGSQYLYLSTGPEEFHGGGPTGDDVNGDGEEESDLSLFAFEFSATGGEDLSFDFNVLTEEVSGGVNDLVIFALDGVAVLEAEIDGGEVAFFSTLFTGFTGPALLGPDGSSFFDGELGFSTFTIAGVTAGLHLLEIMVLDDSDDIVDSALLIDAIALDGTVIEGFEGDAIGSTPSGPGVVGVIGNVSVEGADGFTVLVDEPMAVWLLLAGLVGLIRSRRNA